MKKLICVSLSVYLILSMLCSCSSQNDTQSNVSDEIIIEQIIDDTAVNSDDESNGNVSSKIEAATSATTTSSKNNSSDGATSSNVSSKIETSTTSKTTTSSKNNSSDGVTSSNVSSKIETPTTSVITTPSENSSPNNDKSSASQQQTSSQQKPSACSHSYDEKIIVKAELYKMGEKQYICTNCGDKYTEQYSIESIKLLSISNSYGKNALWELYDICKAEGVKNVDIAVMYIAGCSLDQHWENIQEGNAVYEVFRNNNGSWVSTQNCTIDSLLNEGDWDVITTQNSSGLSGKTDGYKNLNNVADYIKSKCPDSKLIWHHIWGYQSGSKWLTPNNYNGDEKLMYNSIVDRVNDTVIPSGKFDSVVPVGAAVMNARTSSLKNKVHLDDGSHLSEEFGYYVAAFTWYCHLTGQGVYDTNFAINGMVSTSELNIVVESAKNAIENPYKITQSYYTN